MGDRTLNEEEVRKQIHAWEDSGRVFIDIDALLDTESASQVVEFSEKVIWCVSPDNWGSAVSRLKAIESLRARLERQDQYCLAARRRSAVAPWAPELRQLAGNDFKLSFSQPSLHQNRALANGIERLVRELRGIRIGLALGGGRGARHGSPGCAQGARAATGSAST